MPRRIGITPGSGDFVGVLDTEAKDSSGNELSAQFTALVSERGDVAGDITGILQEMLAGINLTNKLLIMQGKRPRKAKG